MSHHYKAITSFIKELRTNTPELQEWVFELGVTLFSVDFITLSKIGDEPDETFPLLSFHTTYSWASVALVTGVS